MNKNKTGDTGAEVERGRGRERERGNESVAHKDNDALGETSGNTPAGTKVTGIKIINQNCGSCCWCCSHCSPGSLVYVPAAAGEEGAAGEAVTANSWQASELAAPLRRSLHPFKLLKIANKINEEQQSHELPALPVQNVAFDLRLQLLEAVK